MKNISGAKWKQVKGSIKEKWGKLTNNEIDVINGRIDQLVGKLEEKYAIKREEAEKDVRVWYERHFTGGKTNINKPKRTQESFFKKLQKL